MKPPINMAITQAPPPKKKKPNWSKTPKHIIDGFLIPLRTNH